MVLAVVYVVIGALLAGFVLWVLAAGGSPLHDYLEQQDDQAGNVWKVVIIVIGTGVAMIFYGLRTLLGTEDKMSRLATLRREWHPDARTRTDRTHGPASTGGNSKSNRL
ncbi:MAG TPA: hypothetical protein VKU85_05260 [bacterium]|nr:hypothetical protein [bacterium]